ncbi:MAG: CHASE3 domain-containing protein [Bacteroidetes bacterium]|nr:CHASE3 domain-containing protein [Bacteroidota bacterium]MCL6098759.1 CHASE3 domain-containing protein [Bacteroidota bacterium]
MKKSKLPIERIVKLGFLLTIAIFILAGTITYRSFNRLIDSAHDVDETIHKLHNLDYLHSLLSDAETGQRGYLLTGKSPYLQPYQEAIDSINFVIVQLNKMILNPEQQLELDTLSLLVNAKLSELKETLDVNKSRGFNAAKQLVVSNRGKVIMDKIRLVLNQIRYYERERLSRYSVERSEMRRQTLYELIGSLILGFLISATTIVLLHKDLKKRIKAESDLKLSQKEMALHVKETPLGVIRWDLDFRVTDWNPSAERIFGYKRDEAIGKHAAELILPEEAKPHVKKVWQALLDQSGGLRSTNNNITKDGSVIICEWYNTPLIDEDGKIIAVASLVDDITERKKMETDLIRAKEKAEEMNRLKSNFFANMSHELRTPFIGIMGYAEFLAQSVTDADDKEMALGILDSSKRLKDTLDKILELSKVESSKVELKLTDVDVCMIINDVHKTFIKLAEQKNLFFKKELSVSPCLIRTDEQLFREILNNLVSNALKFTHRGGVEISLDKNVRGNNTYLAIKVKDTGIGIPADKHDIIWEEFRQVSEGLNRSFEGTGLGLSIAKKYAELLNGKISLESTEGKGSSFILELPFLPSSVQTEVLPGLPQTSEVLSEKPTSCKILYVEDDKYALDVVRRTLSKFYQIDLAENAETALSKVNQNKYDIILMDVNLRHGMDGIELTQVIREIPHYKKVPVVAVTAYAKGEDKDEFLSKGFSHYISKPFVPAELIDLLKNVGR